MQFLSRSFTPSSIRNYLSGVKLLRVITGHPISPFTSYELRLTLHGLERLAQHVPSRAPPITPDILLNIVSQIDLQDPCLVSFSAAFLFTFFLLARVSNIVPRSRSSVHSSSCLRRSNVVFTSDGLLVTFHRTKTIQFGRCRLLLPLSMAGSPLCPVCMFSLMRSLVPAPRDSPAFVLPSDKVLSPITKAQFASVFRTLLHRAGIPDFSVFGVTLFAAGLLRHSSLWGLGVRHL